MFTISLGLAERLAQPADFLAAEVAHAPRAGHAADALGGVPFDLAEADRVLEDRVKCRHCARGHTLAAGCGAAAASHARL